MGYHPDIGYYYDGSEPNPVREVDGIRMYDPSLIGYRYTPQRRPPGGMSVTDYLRSRASGKRPDEQLQHVHVRMALIKVHPSVM